MLTNHYQSHVQDRVNLYLSQWWDQILDMQEVCSSATPGFTYYTQAKMSALWGSISQINSQTKHSNRICSQLLTYNTCSVTNDQYTETYRYFWYRYGMVVPTTLQETIQYLPVHSSVSKYTFKLGACQVLNLTSVMPASSKNWETVSRGASLR